MIKKIFHNKLFSFQYEAFIDKPRNGLLIREKLIWVSLWKVLIEIYNVISFWTSRKLALIKTPKHFFCIVSHEKPLFKPNTCLISTSRQVRAAGHMDLLFVINKINQQQTNKCVTITINTSKTLGDLLIAVKQKMNLSIYSDVYIKLSGEDRFFNYINDDTDISIHDHFYRFFEPVGGLHSNKVGFDCSVETKVAIGNVSEVLRYGVLNYTQDQIDQIDEFDDAPVGPISFALISKPVKLNGKFYEQKCLGAYLEKIFLQLKQSKQWQRLLDTQYNFLDPLRNTITMSFRKQVYLYIRQNRSWVGSLMDWKQFLSTYQTVKMLSDYTMELETCCRNNNLYV